MEETDDAAIADLGSRPPGSDPADPYEDVDVSELPEWWQRTIEEFREYGLRPYRPPRFEDGTLKHEVVEDLKETHDIDIMFVGVDVRYGDDWTVRIDGTPVGEIGHRRSPEGYTVFGMTSDEFVDFVTDRIGEA